MKQEVFNITVKNFGVINKSDIDITPLTIFTGANSSGKSFIARLINTLNSINKDDLHNNISKHFSNTPKYLNNENKKLFNRLSHEITDYFRTNYFKQNNAFKIPIEEFNILLEDGVLKFFSLIFEDLIKEHFSEDLDNLVNFKKSFFEIDITNINFYKKIGERLKFHPKLIELSHVIYTSDSNETIIINVKSDEEYIILNLEHYSNNQKFRDFDSIFSTVYSSVANLIVENIQQKNSYYIPAERSEIIIDKKMLSRAVKKESELSKNQSDVLSNIITIDTSNKSCFYELGRDFDKEFSGILIDIEEDEFINNIIYRDCDSGDIIPSRILSTSIHEMTLFSLYLKYILKKGDFLIIEEPEAHLHPKNQRLLLKYIIKAVNSGLNIILTTHSEYISDQLNNHVRLKNIPIEKVLKLNYTEEDILDYNDLSIYNFKKISNNLYNSEKIAIDETV